MNVVHTKGTCGATTDKNMLILTINAADIIQLIDVCSLHYVSGATYIKKLYATKWRNLCFAMYICNKSNEEDTDSKQADINTMITIYAWCIPLRIKFKFILTLFLNLYCGCTVLHAVSTN